MWYFVKTPSWLKKIYSNRLWEMPVTEKKMYLTFDDGPHPEVTPLVLDMLKQYNARATFFCIGNNVQAQPEVYRRIIEEGHAIGNHTFNHLNGWKTADAVYLDDIAEAKKYIDSNIFRPPYGRMTTFQQKQLRGERFNLKTVMWTVLSGDFDQSINEERCLANVVLHAKEGSIVVFHDSEKARKNMLYALPKVLSYFSERNYTFESIRT